MYFLPKRMLREPIRKRLKQPPEPKRRLWRWLNSLLRGLWTKNKESV